jgi:predicted ATPase/class 3 adenylate cyclase
VTVLPSGTVTFLFTDIAGSTRLWEQYPDAMQPALALHDEVVDAAIVAHHGHVVKTTGDGFHAVFATAHDALAAALGAQVALADASWGATGPLVVRMGLHTGETQERDGDYFGSAVNRAARVMAVAHGGQILATRATVEVAGPAFTTRSLGEHRLRDLGAAQELFQVGDGTFPPLQSVDAVPTNLPTVRTELIGRHDDIDTLAALVHRERLVTLTGVGGVGKTRLALGVAAAVAADFADGCWMVELAPVADGDEVITIVAGTLQAPMTTLDALATYLADRRMVIVLDNCEHVLDAADELVDEILAVAPDVHFVVTSREPLGLDGEHVRRVQSLTLPDAKAGVDTARASASVRLFAERAAAAADGFVIDDANVAPVVEICRHLDGIPLAIELAAARVRAMTPTEIANRLDERFRLLAGGSRRTQERHRTLQATVAWSYDLLTEPEKVVFRRLSVFPASFDLAAAEAVAGDDANTLDVIECLLRLVDRSLVVHEPDANRYRLLETLRQFGADRLTEAGETAEVRARHAEWFLAFAKRIAPGLDDARSPAASLALVTDLDNLRSTADWCIETAAWANLATMAVEMLVFLTQNAPADGSRWLSAIVEGAPGLDPRLVVDVLGALAYLQAQNFGAFATGEELAYRSAALAGEHAVLGSSWGWLGACQAGFYTGRPAEIVEWSTTALELADARDEDGAAVVALINLAMSLSMMGEPIDRPAELMATAMGRAQANGSPLIIQAVVISWAQWLALLPEPDFAASLEVLQRHGTDLVTGDLGDMWLDIAWAVTLLGSNEPGAVARAARGARSADHQNSPHGLAFMLLVLAVAAAEAGHTEQAAALATYIVVNLNHAQYNGIGAGWLQARLDQALGDAAPLSRVPALHRRELLALIDDVETALAGETA